MPRPICVACAIEMVWIKPVIVQFDALSTGGPYQQWQGDLCECPNCKLRIIARFGEQPTWEHFQKDKTKEPAYIIVPERSGLGKVLSPTPPGREVSRR